MTYHPSGFVDVSERALRKQRKITAALIGVPSFVALASTDPPATDSLATPDGAAIVLGILAASLIWRRAPASRPVFVAWAVVLIVASFYPTQQLPGESMWSVVVSFLFAVVLVILGRQVWRVTEGG